MIVFFHLSWAQWKTLGSTRHSAQAVNNVEARFVLIFLFLELDISLLIHCFNWFFCRFDQDVEERLVTSSGCPLVSPWRLPWTAPTTPVPRTFTSFRWKESKVVLTDYLLLASETWWWPPSRRESLISVRRFCQLSSLGRGSRGAERMVSSCTSKVIIIYFDLLEFVT